MISDLVDLRKTFRQLPSSGTSVEAPDFQRRGLRRNRMIATALLGFMAVLFVGTTLAPQPGFLLLLVRATAEAALVGGLADWFAVTALFRHPLGLPIPHTAVLPSNKDRIGEGLAGFIERNFLSPDILKVKLRSLDPARLIADWFSAPANIDAVARRLARMLPYLVAAIDDRDIRGVVGDAIGRRLAEIDLAPLLGRAIAVLTTNGFRESLVDRLLEFGLQFLGDREQQIYIAAEAQRRRWWIPKAVNRQIAKAIIGGVKEFLSDLREPGPARRNLLHAIERLADQLAASPVYSARVEEAKLRLLQDAEIKTWLGSVWSEIRQALLADLSGPRSQAELALSAAILALGRRLASHASLRRRVNRTVEAMALEVIPWRAGLAQFIIEVVRQWDVRGFTNRLELVVGRDLQYIRITGTLVGGLVGCLLYLLSTALQ
jgi:uncharacterized membrane-anchored protein YjiN (DUF445 family)